MLQDTTVKKCIFRQDPLPKWDQYKVKTTLHSKRNSQHSDEKIVRQEENNYKTYN